MADTEVLDDSLSVEDHIRIGNARDAGIVPEPEPVRETPPEPEPEPSPDPEPTLPLVAGETPRIDKRTREGRKLSFQQEIDALATKKHTVQRELDDLEARTAAAKAAAADATKATPPSAVPEKPTPVTASDRRRYQSMPDAPKLPEYDGTDGKTYEDYTADMAAFIADKRFEERFAEREAIRTVQQQTERHLTRLDTAKKADATLGPRIAKMRETLGGDFDFGPYIGEFIRTSELGVDILGHLADHPDIARRLPTLPPLKQAEELGKLEARLDLAKTAARSGPASSPVISTAQPPIKPVGSSPHVTDDDADDGDLPIEEFIRKGNKNDPAINPRAARH